MQRCSVTCKVANVTSVTCKVTNVDVVSLEKLQTLLSKNKYKSRNSKRCSVTCKVANVTSVTCKVASVTSVTCKVANVTSVICKSCKRYYPKISISREIAKTSSCGTL